MSSLERSHSWAEANMCPGEALPVPRNRPGRLRAVFRRRVLSLYKAHRERLHARWKQVEGVVSGDVESGRKQRSNKAYSRISLSGGPLKHKQVSACVRRRCFKAQYLVWDTQTGLPQNFPLKRHAWVSKKCVKCHPRVV